eukprot:m.279351 g.279351  ORF g.279351 m.279351 type:complete len:83 (-) comp140731_c0_seq1:65-313(-)
MTSVQPKEGESESYTNIEMTNIEMQKLVSSNHTNSKPKSPCTKPTSTCTKPTNETTSNTTTSSSPKLLLSFPFLLCPRGFYS